MDFEIHVGQFLEQLGQIGIWLRAIDLTGLDDIVDCGTDICFFGRSTELPVLPSYGKISDGLLTNIVCHGSLSVSQVGTELFPGKKDMLDSLTQWRLQAWLFVHFFDLFFVFHCFCPGSGLLKSTIDGFLRDEIFYAYGECGFYMIYAYPFKIRLYPGERCSAAEKLEKFYEQDEFQIVSSQEELTPEERRVYTELRKNSR